MDFEALLKAASDAGMKAAAEAVPTPMVVRDRTTGQEWFVAGGVCGFAEVVLTPATSDLARYLRKTRMVNKPPWERSKEVGGQWGKAYPSGYSFWVWEGGQSMEVKKAFAEAYAKVLRDAGYNAYATSRMD